MGTKLFMRCCRRLAHRPVCIADGIASAAASARRVATTALTSAKMSAKMTAAEAAAAAELAIQDGYAAMSTETLRDALRVRSLDATAGNRAVLLRHLRDDDAYSGAMISGYQKQRGWQQQQQRIHQRPTLQVQLSPVAPVPAPATPTVDAASAVGATHEVAREAPAAASSEVSGDGDRPPPGIDAEHYRSMRAKFSGVKGRRGAKRSWEVTIRSLGMTPIKHTPAGLPSVTMDVLRALAGKQAMDGRSVSVFCFLNAGSRREGKAAMAHRVRPLNSPSYLRHPSFLFIGCFATSIH